MGLLLLTLHPLVVHHLLRRRERLPHRAHQQRPVLAPHADPHYSLLDAKRCRPLHLAVVRDECVRARERKARAKGRAFVASERIEERSRCSQRDECQREQAAESARKLRGVFPCTGRAIFLGIGLHGCRLMGACGPFPPPHGVILGTTCPLRVEHLLDRCARRAARHRPQAEEICDFLRISVDGSDVGLDRTGVVFHHNGVRAKVRVLEPRVEARLQGGVVRTGRVQGQTAGATGVSGRLRVLGMYEKRSVPPAGDVPAPAEYL